MAATHRVGCIVGDEPGLFPARMITPEVSASDQDDVAQFKIVQKLFAWYADFAHEHLECLMGGGQFFGWSPSVCWASSVFTTFGMFKNSCKHTATASSIA